MYLSISYTFIYYIYLYIYLSSLTCFHPNYSVSIISPHSPEALALYDPPNSKVAEAILEKGSDAGAIRDPRFRCRKSCFNWAVKLRKALNIVECLNLRQRSRLFMELLPRAHARSCNPFVDPDTVRRCCCHPSSPQQCSALLR